jgi:hypothetical protein
LSRKLLLFILTATGFLPGGSGTTIRPTHKYHNESNGTQYNKLHTQQTPYTEWIQLSLECKNHNYVIYKRLFNVCVYVYQCSWHMT